MLLCDLRLGGESSLSGLISETQNLSQHKKNKLRPTDLLYRMITNQGIDGLELKRLTEYPSSLF